MDYVYDIVAHWLVNKGSPEPRRNPGTGHERRIHTKKIKKLLRRFDEPHAANHPENLILSMSPTGSKKRCWYMANKNTFSRSNTNIICSTGPGLTFH